MIAPARVAAIEQVPIIAGVFARAFAEDPMIVWPFPHDGGDHADRRLDLFTRMLETYVPAGVVWQVGDGSGAAAWIPPGRLDLYDTMDEGIRAGLGSLTDDDGARYRVFWDWLAARATAEPVWFLDIIAVDPNRQGRGYGAALIDVGLETSRRTGVPALLETGNEANVAYYERFGFRLTDHADAPDGGPHIWFMRFEP